MKKFILSIALALFVFPCAVLAQYDKDVFMWRGRQALSEGKYAQAIDNFNILTRLDSTEYWGYFFRGIAKYNLGDIRGADQDFNTSVRLNPVFTDGYHYRAITRSRFEDYQGALDDFDKALSLRPGLYGIYFSRGVTYFLAQRFEEAVQDFNYYIRREPRDPSAYLNRGACYLFLSDTLKALADYNQAIRLDRYEPESYIRRARIYSGTGELDKAVEDLDMAIALDSTNTLAYFERALISYDRKDYNGAMADLNTVLRHEPGNALTLYNRSLIYMQVGEMEKALEDIDRVININPDNVLAHFNRAAIFANLERWEDALADYDKSIELYPDFARAYMNRSYVKSMMGRFREADSDYRTAQEKIREYRESSQAGSFADTTRKYSSLLAFDADFAQENFDNELLQNRNVDIRLKPLYRFTLAAGRDEGTQALSKEYENALIDRFRQVMPVPVEIRSETVPAPATYVASTCAEEYFAKGLQDLQDKKFNSALEWFDKAVESADDEQARDKYSRYYKAFYLMNRGVLKAEMIDFIASLEGNVQTLSMDTQGAARARVNDRVARSYDYSEAIADIRAALDILPDIPYLYFDLGNLLCQSDNMVEAIENYDMAIRLHPYMGDAYFNRGLVLIYLHDEEKGCIDLSRAGELGVAESYNVISRYCSDEGD